MYGFSHVKYQSYMKLIKKSLKTKKETDSFSYCMLHEHTSMIPLHILSVLITAVDNPLFSVCRTGGIKGDGERARMEAVQGPLGKGSGALAGNVRIYF